MLIGRGGLDLILLEEVGAAHLAETGRVQRKILHILPSEPLCRSHSPTSTCTTLDFPPATFCALARPVPPAHNHAVPLRWPVPGLTRRRRRHRLHYVAINNLVIRWRHLVVRVLLILVMICRRLLVVDVVFELTGAIVGVVGLMVQLVL